jgi:hypothetical protein
VSDNGFDPGWLALREPADAAARSTELLSYIPMKPGMVIRDLGCGTGSMGRWLAPRLPAPQHWILHDHDPALLERAARSLPPQAGPVETERRDVSGLTAEELAGTSLVTASALLDLFTRPQLDALADACADVPVLFTLSVLGRVELAPHDPLDAVLEAAFNEHQRRDGLLGPAAADAAREAFTLRGARVASRETPWRLDDGPLLAEWLRGWVGAAVEQRPELADPATEYLNRGKRSAIVHHRDFVTYRD